jgi:hypothetical protein
MLRETEAMEESGKRESQQMPIDFWEGWTPDGVVSGIYTELYTHVVGVLGYSQLLHAADLKPEDRLRITEDLLEHAQYIKSVFEAIHHYSISQRRSTSSTANVSD